MSSNTQAVFMQALALPAASKIDLVDLLLNSIEEEASSPKAEIDSCWAHEAKERFAAFLDGRIKAESREEVMQALRERHKQ